MDKWILPLVVLAVLAWALAHRVNAYQSFVNGVKEGLDLFVSVYPAMLAMPADGERAGHEHADGAGKRLLQLAVSRSARIGVADGLFPPDLRQCLAGHPSFDLHQGRAGLAGRIHRQHPQGATDTTFYVIALYFGSVGVRKIKSALGIGLIADAAGMITAIVLGLMFYGG